MDRRPVVGPGAASGGRCRHRAPRPDAAAGEPDPLPCRTRAAAGRVAPHQPRTYTEARPCAGLLLSGAPKMASFRVLDPFQTFFNLSSTGPAAGGRVDFFDAGTTTPRAVYADPDLGVSNGSTIALDAAGRLSVDCWGQGAYRARQ